MNCEQCKWFVGNVNDHYGICKRYPLNQNKTKNDFCGEYADKNVVQRLEIKFEEPTQYDIHTDQVTKRGRKPKNVD